MQCVNGVRGGERGRGEEGSVFISSHLGLRLVLAVPLGLGFGLDVIVGSVVGWLRLGLREG